MIEGGATEIVIADEKLPKWWHYLLIVLLSVSAVYLMQGQLPKKAKPAQANLQQSQPTIKKLTAAVEQGNT
ncbi:MAG: hypothetical protein LPJ89_10525, partial [Hymenobacteraceae bacterium]|nr:hypothetical protein [Hymenobacteraceae bacterium]